MRPEKELAEISTETVSGDACRTRISTMQISMNIGMTESIKPKAQAEADEIKSFEKNSRMLRYSDCTKLNSVIFFAGAFFCFPEPLFMKICVRSVPLEFREFRCARIGNHVADIFHARDIADQPLKAKPEPGVRHSAEPAQVKVPAVD